MVVEGMMSEIDCRGKTCPQPVILTKEALDQRREGELTIIVDNSSSCENVERFVRSHGCSVTIERRGQDFYLHIQKGNAGDDAKLLQEKEKAKRIIVYTNSHLLGVGDEALGSILMKAFLKTLLDIETKPSRLILINSGVRLASEGSEVLETLRALSERGVEILSCGTCLDFYGLKEKVRVGVISNMYEITQTLLHADHIIRP
jgi:selenium metabolism protein YedF